MTEPEKFDGLGGETPLAAQQCRSVVHGSFSQSSNGQVIATAEAQQRLVDTEKLLDEHQEAVFRYAFRLSGCSSTAEDISQEVFLRAFRNLHQLRDQAAARGWLLVIARNEFMRWCRKSKAGGISVDPQDCDILDDIEQPQVDNQEWVESALRQLPDDFRLVLLMYYFEELSYAEIAEQLNIPLGTVMSRLNRGRAHMKTALEKINTRTV